MSNELILILTLIITFSLVVVCYYMFQKEGLFAWAAVAAVVANIEVVVLIKAFGMDQTLGNILFASTCLVTDIINEVYGKEQARKSINIGVFISILFMVLSQSWFLYTPSVNDVGMKGIELVFANTPRLIISSLVVYLTCQKFDIWVYHIIWNVTKKWNEDQSKYWWIRKNLSTLLSQFLNTILFSVFAFMGVYSIDTLITIIIASYAVFIVTSIADTPFFYLALKIAKSKGYGVYKK